MNTEEETLAECERLFQNGGPKVYVLRKRGDSPYLYPSQLSGRATVLCAVKGESVYQRRKFGRRYRFIKIGEGS